MDDTENLFQPGRFQFQTSTIGSVTIWASMEPRGRQADEKLDWETEIRRH